MTPATFRLLPHEVGDLAPDVPLCAPAEWRVKTSWLGGEFLVRAVEFRSDKRTLVARHQGQIGAPLLRLNTSHLATRLLGNDELIQNDLRHNQFERRLAFDEYGRLVKEIGQTRAWLHLNFTGQTFWMNNAEEQFRFVWRGFDREHRFDEKRRAQMTDAQIECEIGQMLSDEKSDCAFARTWLVSSEREREQSLYCAGRGSLSEIEALLRAVCVCGAGELPGANWRLMLNVAVGAGTAYYAGGAGEMLHRSYLSNDEDSGPLSPVQVRLATLVLQHFELWRNWNAQTYTLVREQWRGGNGYWRIPFSAPSMHDSLEARLLLRDWLQGKVSSTELDELMPR